MFTCWSQPVDCGLHRSTVKPLKNIPGKRLQRWGACTGREDFVTSLVDRNIPACFLMPNRCCVKYSVHLSCRPHVSLQRCSTANSEPLTTSLYCSENRAERVGKHGQLSTGTGSNNATPRFIIALSLVHFSKTASVQPPKPAIPPRTQRNQQRKCHPCLWTATKLVRHAPDKTSTNPTPTLSTKKCWPFIVVSRSPLATVVRGKPVLASSLACERNSLRIRRPHSRAKGRSNTCPERSALQATRQVGEGREDRQGAGAGKEWGSLKLALRLVAHAAHGKMPAVELL